MVSVLDLCNQDPTVCECQCVSIEKLYVLNKLGCVICVCVCV